MRISKVVLFSLVVASPSFAASIDYSACGGQDLYQARYELGADGKMRKPKKDPFLIKYSSDQNGERAITEIPQYMGNPKGMLTMTLSTQDGRAIQYTTSEEIARPHSASVSTSTGLSTGSSSAGTYSSMGTSFPTTTNFSTTTKFGYLGNKCFVSEISESTNGASIVTYNAELCNQVEEAAKAIGDSKLSECANVMGKIEGIRNAFQNRPDMQGKKLGYSYTHDFSMKVQEFSAQHDLDGMSNNSPVDAINLIGSCRTARAAFTPLSSGQIKALRQMEPAVVDGLRHVDGTAPAR